MNNNLKNYKNYINEQRGELISKEEIDARIKEIISNILKVKRYFLLLQDTADSVYNMLENQFPPNRDQFFGAMYQKDQILAETLEEISDSLEGGFATTEIAEIVELLKRLESYTDGNMDNILSGQNINIEKDDFEEEEGGEEDDDEEEGEEVDIEDDEDQLQRKPKPTNESKLRGKKELEEFIKKHTKKKETREKPIPRGKFKKGDIVWLNGMSGMIAKRFNGKRCEVIGETPEKEGCYDLYDPTLPKSDDEKANITGMPSEFMFREKPDVIIEKKPRIGKKGNG